MLTEETEVSGQGTNGRDMFGDVRQLVQLRQFAQLKSFECERCEVRARGCLSAQGPFLAHARGACCGCQMLTPRAWTSHAPPLPIYLVPRADSWTRSTRMIGSWAP